MHYDKRWWKLSFSRCDYTLFSKAYKLTLTIIYITPFTDNTGPCIEIYTMKPMFSLTCLIGIHFLWNLFEVNCSLSKTCSMLLNTFQWWRFVYCIWYTRLQNFVNLSPLIACTFNALALFLCNLYLHCLPSVG